MNQNWPRWIFASASKVIKERCGNIDFFIEGQQRQTEHSRAYFEFRLDGPYFIQQGPSFYKTIFEINILAVCLKNDDLHAIYRLVGIAANALKEIPIHRYGDGPDDDDSLLSCFLLVTSNDQREAIRISHFGQIDPNKPLLQASIEAHFTANLNG